MSVIESGQVIEIGVVKEGLSPSIFSLSAKACLFTIIHKLVEMHSHRPEYSID